MAVGQEDFKKILKEKGLKVTRQRLVVLEIGRASWRERV